MFTSKKLGLGNNYYTMLDVINIVKGPNGIHCQLVFRACFQDLHFKKLKLIFFFIFLFDRSGKTCLLAPCHPPTDCVSKVYKNKEN